jgi:hypothetical protein
MDYTPIHVRRVLMSFAITVLVALLPAAIGFVRSGVASRLVHETLGGLGLTSGTGVAFLLVVLGLVSSAVYFGRRLVRRPFRA